MKISNILLTTDFSDLARNAYPTAVSLARQYQATVHLVYVAKPLPPYYYLNLEGISTNIPEDSYYDELERNLEEEASWELAREGIDVRTTLLMDATPHVALQQLMKERLIDLVLISTHGRTGLGHALLGSFAEKMVRYSQVPVMTIRQAKKRAEPCVPRTVLVPFDFSANARTVLPLVHCLARKYDPRFIFVHVLESEDLLPDRYTTESWGDMLRKAAQEARIRAAENFEKLRQKELEGLKVTFETFEGVPQDVINSNARKDGVDLILMATHGRTGLKHFFLGSVAEKAVRKAPCAVLTVRPQGVRQVQEGRNQEKGSLSAH